MTNKSGDGNHPQNKHPYRFYWLTAGLATIAGAIIVVSVTHSSTESVSSPGPSESTSPSPSSPSATPSYIPPSPTVSSASATTNTGKLRWRARINLSSLQYIDIDAPEPSAGNIPNGEVQNGVLSPGNPEYIILSGLGGPNGNIRGGIVTSAQATYNTCRSALNMNSTEQYIQTLEPGQTLCVLSAEAVQHLAALKLISYDSSTMVLVFNVIVWDYNS